MASAIATNPFIPPEPLGGFVGSASAFPNGSAPGATPGPGFVGSSNAFPTGSAPGATPGPGFVGSSNAFPKGSAPGATQGATSGATQGATPGATPKTPDVPLSDVVLQGPKLLKIGNELIRIASKSDSFATNKVAFGNVYIGTIWKELNEQYSVQIKDANQLNTILLKLQAVFGVNSVSFNYKTPLEKGCRVDNPDEIIALLKYRIKTLNQQITNTKFLGVTVKTTRLYRQIDLLNEIIKLLNDNKSKKDLSICKPETKGAPAPGATSLLDAFGDYDALKKLLQAIMVMLGLANKEKLKEYLSQQPLKDLLEALEAKGGDYADIIGQLRKILESADPSKPGMSMNSGDLKASIDALQAKIAELEQLMKDCCEESKLPPLPSASFVGSASAFPPAGVPPPPISSLQTPYIGPVGTGGLPPPAGAPPPLPGTGGLAPQALAPQSPVEEPLPATALVQPAGAPLPLALAPRQPAVAPQPIVAPPQPVPLDLAAQYFNDPEVNFKGDIPPVIQRLQPAGQNNNTDEEIPPAVPGQPNTAGAPAQVPVQPPVQARRGATLRTLRPRANRAFAQGFRSAFQPVQAGGAIEGLYDGLDALGSEDEVKNALIEKLNNYTTDEELIQVTQELDEQITKKDEILGEYDQKLSEINDAFVAGNQEDVTRIHGEIEPIVERFKKQDTIVLTLIEYLLGKLTEKVARLQETSATIERLKGMLNQFQTAMFGVLGMDKQDTSTMTGERIVNYTNEILETLVEKIGELTSRVEQLEAEKREKEAEHDGAVAELQRQINEAKADSTAKEAEKNANIAALERQLKELNETTRQGAEAKAEEIGALKAQLAQLQGTQEESARIKERLGLLIGALGLDDELKGRIEAYINGSDDAELVENVKESRSEKDGQICEYLYFLNTTISMILNQIYIAPTKRFTTGLIDDINILKSMTFFLDSFFAVKLENKKVPFRIEDEPFEKYIKNIDAETLTNLNKVIKPNTFYSNTSITFDETHAILRFTQVPGTMNLAMFTVLYGESLRQKLNDITGKLNCKFQRPAMTFIPGEPAPEPPVESSVQTNAEPVAEAEVQAGTAMETAGAEVQAGAETANTHAQTATETTGAEVQTNVGATEPPAEQTAQLQELREQAQSRFLRDVKEPNNISVAPGAVPPSRPPSQVKPPKLVPTQEELEPPTKSLEDSIYFLLQIIKKGSSMPSKQLDADIKEYSESIQGKKVPINNFLNEYITSTSLFQTANLGKFEEFKALSEDAKVAKLKAVLNTIKGEFQKKGKNFYAFFNKLVIDLLETYKIDGATTFEEKLQTMLPLFQRIGDSSLTAKRILDFKVLPRAEFRPLGGLRRGGTRKHQKVPKHKTRKTKNS